MRDAGGGRGDAGRGDRQGDLKEKKSTDLKNK